MSMYNQTVMMPNDSSLTNEDALIWLALARKTDINFIYPLEKNLMYDSYRTAALRDAAIMFVLTRSSAPPAGKPMAIRMGIDT